MTWQHEFDVQSPQGETSYGAVRVILSHFDCPGGCAISTIQDTSDRVDRREDQSTIKDDVEHLVLSLETVCFFL